MKWFAADMDDGVLYVGRTRTEVVEWCRSHIGVGGKVLERHTYRPGMYDYWIGTDKDDCDTVSVVREDILFGPYGLSPEHRAKYERGELG